MNNEIKEVYLLDMFDQFNLYKQASQRLKTETKAPRKSSTYRDQHGTTRHTRTGELVTDWTEFALLMLSDNESQWDSETR